jgi:hypothetical protein
MLQALANLLKLVKDNSEEEQSDKLVLRMQLVQME